MSIQASKQSNSANYVTTTMRTRRSASSPADTAAGASGGGILASIPSLPSSSSRTSRRPGAAAAAASATQSKRTGATGATAKNDASTSRRLLGGGGEDTDTAAAKTTKTRTNRRETGGGGAGGGPANRRRTGAATAGAAAALHPPVSSSQNQQPGGSNSRGSNPTKRSARGSTPVSEATTRSTTSKQKKTRASATKENTAAATGTDQGVDAVLVALEDDGAADAKAAKNGNGNAKDPVPSAAADDSYTSTGVVGKKKAVPPAKAAGAGGGGKPPAPRSASSSTLPSAAASRTRPPMPGGVTATVAVRGGRPPTPRNENAADAGNNAAAVAGAKRTTFLSGYNLDCTKTSTLLDLPDPPTPEDDGDGNTNGSERQQDKKAKRRRRMSTGASAFGSTAGSRRTIGPSGGEHPGTKAGAGVTNSAGGGRDGDGAAVGTAAPRNIVFDDLSARARGQRRKVRNSLCHVPSPVETSSMADSTPNSTGHNDGVETNNDQIEKAASRKSPEKGSSAKADNDQDFDDEPSPLGKGGIVFDGGDDDDDDDASSDGSAAKKRRKKQPQRSSRPKKRQSVFLPSDLKHISSVSGSSSSAAACNEDNDVDGFYSDLLSYKASATSTASADSSMSLCSNASVGSNADTNDAAKIAAELPPVASRDDPNTANLLLQAVREICSLPESERYGSEQAGVVEVLGGYPYVPPAEKERMKPRRIGKGKKGDGEDLNWTLSPNTPGGPENGTKPADDPPMSPIDPVAATLEKRKELILTLGPVVERMEAKRKEETDAARQATGCRVSRTKRGRYKYYDVASGDEVAPEEYKRRYLAMIGKNRGIDQNDSDSAGLSISTEAKCEVEKFDSAKSEDTCLAAVAKDKSPSDTKVSQAEAPDQETSAAHETDMSIDDDGEDMDISLMSMQDVEGVVPKGADDGEPGLERTIENGSFKLKENSSVPKSDEVEEEKVASPAYPEHDQSSSSEFILPLPDRDDPDTDPQIAAAERRLWSDIDTALARYSREVISIRAARKMGFTLSQTVDSP